MSLCLRCGFEVYDTTGHVLVEPEERPQVDSIRVGSVLQLRELGERLHQQLYAIHDMVEEDCCGSRKPLADFCCPNIL
jgi:hypothetical protein